MKACGRLMPSMNSTICLVCGSSTMKVEKVGEIEIGFVARRHRIGKAQAAVGGAFQPELHGAAGLENPGDGACRHLAQFGVGIGEQFFAVAVGAHAVRAADAQFAAGEKVFEPCAARPRRLALAVADRRRIDRRRFDAGGFRVGQHVGDVRRRHDHHGMIDRLADVAQRRETALAVNRLLPRIDQMDFAAVAVLAQIAENLAGPARPLRGADDRHGRGPQHARRRPQHAVTARQRLLPVTRLVLPRLVSYFARPAMLAPATPTACME